MGERTMPPQCPTHDELKAFCLGNLASGIFEHVAQHVVECTDCDAMLRILDEQSDGLVTELRQLAAHNAAAAAIPASLISVARSAGERFLQTDSEEIAVDPGRRFARLVA